MDNILRLAKNYSKDDHLTLLPCGDNNILDNFNFLYDENWENYKKTDLDEIENQIIPIVEAELKVYRDGMNTVTKLAMEGNSQDAFEKYKVLSTKADEFQKNLKIKKNENYRRTIYADIYVHGYSERKNQDRILIC